MSPLLRPISELLHTSTLVSFLNLFESFLAWIHLSVVHLMAKCPLVSVNTLENTGNCFCLMSCQMHRNTIASNSASFWRTTTIHTPIASTRRADSEYVLDSRNRQIVGELWPIVFTLYLCTSIYTFLISQRLLEISPWNLAHKCEPLDDVERWTSQKWLY